VTWSGAASHRLNSEQVSRFIHEEEDNTGNMVGLNLLFFNALLYLQKEESTF
jgi:hypothetical protein